MFRKIGVVMLLAGAALFVLPSAANAAYVPDNLGGDGAAQNIPGGGQTVAFAGGAFAGGSETGEQVEVVVEGEPTPTLGMIQAKVSRVYTADKYGALKFRIIIPVTATPDTVYKVVAHGVSSGTYGTYVVTIVSRDSDAGRALLAATGSTTTPTLVVWGGAGVLLLGGALLTVQRIGRRNSQKA